MYFIYKFVLFFCPMEEVYLKCNYFPGMFVKEYFVSFKGSEYPNSLSGGVYVEGEGLLKSDESSGLVKVLIAKKEEKTSDILVRNSKEDGAKFFIVPNEELVFE